MAGKTDFTPDEWKTLLESVMMAGLAVTAADPSGLWGTLKESMATARSGHRRETRCQCHGAHQGTRWRIRDGRRARRRSRRAADAAVWQNARRNCRRNRLEILKQAAAIVSAKSPADAAAFKAWLQHISQSVAEASAEGGFLGFGGVQVSDAEKATLAQIAATLALRPDRGWPELAAGQRAVGASLRATRASLISSAVSGKAQTFRACKTISIFSPKSCATATSRPTAPGPERARFSAIRCGLPLAQGFPLVTTKKLHWKSIVHELLWFLRGDTNIAYLKEHGVGIWDEWADQKRRSRAGLWQAMACLAGPGRAGDRPDFRCRGGNQTQSIFPPLDCLRLEPRRSASDGARALPLPVSILRQRGDRRRKTSLLPALPALGGCVFGRAFQYRKLCAADGDGRACDRPRDVAISCTAFGDAHLYQNHLEQARLQLTRTPRPLPRLKLNPKFASLFDFRFEDITLEAYDPYPPIAAPIAI